MNASSTVTPGYVSALAMTLLHTLWQGTAAAGLLWAVLKTIPSRRATIRYLAACAALLLVVITGGLTFTRCLPSAQGSAAHAGNPEAPSGLHSGNPDAFASTPASVQPAAHLSGATATNPKPGTRNPGPVSEPPGLAAPETDSSPSPAAAGGHPPDSAAKASRFAIWMPWLVGLWAAGVLACLLRLTAEWRLLRQWRKQAQPCPEGPWHDAFDRLLTRLRLSKSIRLLISAGAPVPMVIGWLRPVVLMPAELLAGLPAGQTEALLAHELAHIRRWDFAVNLLQSAVEILFFHHPAVRWISAQIRAEREHCCDDTAARLCGGPLPYARALAALDDFRSGTAPALCPAATSSPLVRRIRRLAAPSTAFSVASLWPALTAGAALALVVIGLPWLRAQEKPAESAAAVPPSTSTSTSATAASASGPPAGKPGNSPGQQPAASVPAPTMDAGPYSGASFPVSSLAALEARALEAVNAFLSAPTAADKMRWMLPDEETQSAALAFYTRHPQMAKATPGTQFGPGMSQGSGEVALGMEIPELEGTYFFSVRPTAQGPRIDWLGSTVYLRQLYEDIRTDMPETPIRIRAMMLQGDYYNKAFSDRARYRCYELVHPGLDRKFYGYERVIEPSPTDPGSDATGSPPAALAGLNLNLRPGFQTIEIKYPDSQKDPSQVEIVHVPPKPASQSFLRQPQGPKLEALRAQTSSEFRKPAVDFDPRGFGDARPARLRDFGAAAFNDVSLSLPEFAPSGERKPLPPRFTGPTHLIPRSAIISRITRLGNPEFLEIC